MDLSAKGVSNNGVGIAALVLVRSLLQKLEQKSVLSKSEVEEIIQSAIADVGKPTGGAVQDAVAFIRRLKA